MKTTDTPILIKKDIVNSYEKFCRPELTKLLKSINLDAVYQKAEGNYLWRAHNNDLLKTLDLAGGYGANLFGHNHPELKSKLLELYERNTPFLTQASCHAGAAQLAEKLNSFTDEDCITIFTNSGTETVEAALKHAYLKYKKPYFLAIKGAFHGKTLGSVQLTWSYKSPFSDLGFQTYFLDFNDPQTWNEAEKIIDKVSAIIFEPILGEGGVKELPEDFVEWLITIRKNNEFSLIADEIQAGMGRTGEFFATTKYRIKPDCICLSKSLGGGLVKIGALMINEKHFVSEFSLIHTSTFAEDDISCFVALKALEVLEQDKLIDKCKVQGDYFLKELRKLQEIFPQQIKEVRGKGLLIGIELYDKIDSSSNLLHLLSIQGYLSYVVSSYLLNVHNIRLAPTLGQPHTLRIAPSAYISKLEIDYFIQAFSDICEALAEDDIIKPMCQTDEFVINSKVVISNKQTRRETPRVNKKVAFIGHFIEAKHARLWDSTLEQIQDSDLEIFLKKLSPVSEPAIFEEIHVKSQTGDEVHLSFIGLNITSKGIEDSMRNRDTEWISKKIEKAVIMAKEEGCQAIGFGGYTSIITQNCYRIKTEGIGLTTGNSLTVGMGILAIKEAAKMQDINLSEASLAVVGATGNIASVYSIIMAPCVKEVVLIVRNINAPKLKALVKNIEQVAPNTKIRITDEMQDLDNSSLILSSSNSEQAIIYPRHLRKGPAVICDIALPFDVSPEVEIVRPDVIVIQGGIVRLPDIPQNNTFKIGGIPLEFGHAFACMSETILMGLEGISDNGSYGRITPEQVEKMLALAEKHGFALEKLKTVRSY